MNLLILWLMAATISGGSVGLLGIHVVGMRMSFLAIAMAHAGLAGAILAIHLDIPQEIPVLTGTLLAALIIGTLTTNGRLRESQPSGDRATALIMSLSMGIAFLGIGLFRDETSQMLEMLWGNILFITPKDITMMSGAATVQFIMLYRYGRRLDALAFSQETARSAGIQDRKIIFLFLIVAAVVITVNLRAVGGLLIYALLTNPASGAFLIAKNMRQACWFSMLGGIVASLGGFIIAYLANLPAGSCIVLSGVCVYAGLGMVAYLRDRQHFQT